jgi:hypothetical protein
MPKALKLKRIIAAQSLCFLVALLLFSCKKTSSTENDGSTNYISTTEKPPITATDGDDTPVLQTLLNAGNTTLIAGKIYHVTGLNVTHSIDLNGATIILTNKAPSPVCGAMLLWVMLVVRAAYL